MPSRVGCDIDAAINYLNSLTLPIIWLILYCRWPYSLPPAASLLTPTIDLSLLPFPLPLAPETTNDDEVPPGQAMLGNVAAGAGALLLTGAFALFASQASNLEVIIL
ncbi:hypothetical protein BDP27DRAFT_1407748 [Rhodocollybia butyracea]|uniref:Uncharacterized protein n=1 Tax=Rhodocollybia butyracea TaxID=206335 RepID=A0A9P5P8H1_9AGAR|nr:hypothetical protein BDP27DRAFT_1407748 [Rhodocollybia butyracea]